MAAAEWWCWPLPAWLGSGAAWFVRDGSGRREDKNSMTMDEAYALVLAGRQRAPPTEEEAAGSEVDAKAEEFIQAFKEDLRQQRLKSIFNYTQMLKRRVAAGRPPAAP
uniref:Uncharacterized protein n=1 Tax=Aegilops tauschii TaxID=37682 RepID=M8C1H2_AEGTA